MGNMKNYILVFSFLIYSSNLFGLLVFSFEECKVSGVNSQELISFKGEISTVLCDELSEKPKLKSTSKPLMCRFYDTTLDKVIASLEKNRPIKPLKKIRLKLEVGKKSVLLSSKDLHTTILIDDFGKAISRSLLTCLLYTSPSPRDS